MIQFLKSHRITIAGKAHVIVAGQKVNVSPELEAELIDKKIARKSKWNGKVEKMKTDLFKPKDL
jgi:hypothetical protein